MSCIASGISYYVHMLVEFHKQGVKTDTISVELASRPSKIMIDNTSEEVFLDWDATVDDSDRLRSCIVCSRDLYKERAFPQITGIVIVFAFAGGIAGVVGFLTTWSMLMVMVIVLIVDIAILLFDKPRLVCYGCGTKFKKTAIAPHFQGWDQHRAEQISRTLD
jgi:hypothetical protein